MNEYVQKYLEKRDAQRKEDLMRQAQQQMNNLRIGEREYPKDSEYDRNDYPYWDTEKGKYYRYNVGEISEEECRLLVQDTPEEKIFVEKKERSVWYVFATFILILSSIGLLVLSIFSITEETVLYFLIGLGEFFVVSLFCAIVQLLANIKQDVDNLLSMQE